MSGGSFQHDIAGGGGNLVATSVQSPNYSPGSSGWQIRKDGSSEFNNLTIRGTFSGNDFILNSSGMFIYSGTPATGNLITSIAPVSGTDSFGNGYPAGLNVSAGQISGIDVTAQTLTVDEGPVLFYDKQSTTVTFAAGASGNWTAPAGVTSVQVVAIGGGNSGSIVGTGGYGGGGGECASETSYTVIPGHNYPYSVGNAGQSTTFDTTGVVAHAGTAATSSAPGSGGTGSTNSIANAGGPGGNPFPFFSQSGGGGSSGGPSQPGNAGSAASGGAAPDGGGAGGGIGQAGQVPGGGGGGNTSGSPKAGAGGQLQLTYLTGTATLLQLAVAAQSGSDTFGNSWPAGLSVNSAAAITGNLSVTGSASVTATLTVNSTDVGGTLAAIISALSGAATSSNGLTDGTINGSSSTAGLANGQISGTSGGASAGTAHTHGGGSYAVTSGQHSHNPGSYAVTNGTHSHTLPTV